MPGRRAYELYASRRSLTVWDRRLWCRCGVDTQYDVEH
jgi:hypothetical protein